MTRLYVGNLPYDTTNQDLQELFAKIGAVTSATIITDRYSGRSKGFGFVEMENDQDAEKAIKEINGTQIGGRSVVVSVAKPREERPRTDFGRNDRRDFRRDNRR